LIDYGHYYNNQNEYPVFKLSKINGHFSGAHLRALALPLMRIEDQGSGRNAAPRRQIQNLLSRLQEKYHNVEHPELNQPIGREAALRQHGEFGVK
jgi:hypothetical protein